MAKQDKPLISVVYCSLTTNADAWGYNGTSLAAERDDTYLATRQEACTNKVYEAKDGT